MKSFLKTIIHYLFPFTCFLCSEKTHRDIDLCEACEADLPWLRQGCLHCAKPLISEMNSICGSCLVQPLPFVKTCILFGYEGVIKKLITGFKFHHNLVYGQILGNLLGSKLSQFYRHESLPQCIIPVPLYQRRLRERGFNQALELARPIKKRLNLPIDYHCCQRIRETKAQSSLVASKRAANVKAAFVVNPNVEYHHIALLDDVMTTAHTLIELSQSFYHVGVKRVDVWCCARTNSNDKF